jgi:hypothetical protein
MMTIEAGTLVRRKSDGLIGRIERRDWVKGKARRFDVVIFEGAMHLPEEFEEISNDEEGVSR